MISALEALRLPNAQVLISPSDAEAADKYLVEIEEYIRSKMILDGVTMQLDHSRLNPGIAAKILMELRLGGWRAEYQMKREPSKVMPGTFGISYYLVMTPGEAAYAEVGAESVKVST